MMLWRETPPATQIRLRGIRLAVVAAAVAAMGAVAAGETDPMAAAESTFLALLTGALLACLAILAHGGARELGWTALLATTAMWIVGYGPHRGALVSGLLLAGLAVAVRRGGGAELLRSPGRSAALALGLQVLARGDLLLLPLLDARTLVSVLLLPVVCGVSLCLLASRFGASAAWIAGAAAFVLSPGWNVTVTLALGSLAAGVVLERRELPAWLRAAAGASLLVPILWDRGLGALFVIGALTLLVEGRLSWLLAMASFAVLAWSPPVGLGPGLPAFWSVVLVLVPALPVGPREGRHLVLRGALLSLVAAMLGGGSEVLSGGLALAALGLGQDRPEAEAADGASHVPCLEMQLAWISFLALGTALLATYPWLREEPLVEVLDLLGLRPGRPAVIAALILVVGVGWGLDLARRRLGGLRPARVLVLAALVALAWKVPGTAAVPISFEPRILDADHPFWVGRIQAAEIAGGVIDTHLVHGAELAVGTHVATIRLRGADRRLIGSWDLLAGFDTAEWAAARPDVADRPGFRAPAPWLSQVTSDRTFFSQRFRARFFTAERHEAAVVVVRRNPDLPSDVRLTIHRLELRR